MLHFYFVCPAPFLFQLSSQTHPSGLCPPPAYHRLSSSAVEMERLIHPGVLGVETHGRLGRGSSLLLFNCDLAWDRERLRQTATPSASFTPWSLPAGVQPLCRGFLNPRWFEWTAD